MTLICPLSISQEAVLWTAEPSTYGDAAGKPGATTSYTENSTVQPVEPRRVLYSYYTAGSGGVGPTILETSLLLAGTPVTVYANGEKVALPVSQHASCSGFGKCRAFLAGITCTHLQGCSLVHSLIKVLVGACYCRCR